MLVASEAVPFAKTGGLGDVVGAIPLALARRGIDATVILPRYPCTRAIRQSDLGARLEIEHGGDSYPIRIFDGSVERDPRARGRVRFLLVDQPSLFERDGIYVDAAGTDYPDNCARFAFLSRSATLIVRALGIPVDCWHVHDWQTAMMPLIAHPDQGTVLTIHNILFQGVFPISAWTQTGLNPSGPIPQFLAYHGQFSLLKGGILAADVLTTVSKRYAREIQAAEHGFGLERAARARRRDLIGIVNGIDAESYDAQTDPALPAHYSVKNWPSGKARCQAGLLKSLGWKPERGMPLVGMVGRLTEQKGLDLVLAAADELLRRPIRFVLLGSGEERYRVAFAELAHRHPERWKVNFAFDEELARRIYAGANMLLMPSRFEPCGLSQLYALRYGTVPIVRAVGGLADTVVDATDRAMEDGTATGFTFSRYSPRALLHAVDRALVVFGEKVRWARLVRRGMTRDCSWDSASRHYIAAYERARKMARERALATAKKRRGVKR